MQELKKRNSGEPELLACAIRDKPLSVCSLEEITQCFRYVMMKLGLRSQNWPSEIERALITQHLLHEYGAHTLEEIRLAFDMAICRRLDVDPNCYENFSCEYISRVMGAYRKWAAQEVRELPTPPPPPAKVQEDLSEQSMQDWLQAIVRRVKGAEITFEYMPPMLYAYLDRRGEIVATKEEKREYLQKAAAWRSVELQKAWEKNSSTDNYRALQSFRAMREQGYFQGAEIDRVKLLAKKLLFFDHVLKNY